MRKIVLPILIMLFVLAMMFATFLFHLGKDNNEVVEVNDKKEEIVEIENKVYPNDVYRMLDFDRRLILQIGQQDKNVCSIYNLAYARAILDNKKINPYDYFDGEGAVWNLADFDDIAHDSPLSVVLQRAYDEIDNGKPTIFFVSGEYGYTTSSNPIKRTSYDHYVLIIGYRMNADYDNLKPSDFYAADPSSGYCCDVDGYMPWIILTDDAPELVSNEYALYALFDDKKVGTCIAYPDNVTWDNNLKEIINPNYYIDN